MGGCQSIGLVSAPMIGGVLIDAFNWLACFGINLPLGVLCIALTAYGFHDPVPNPDTALPLKEKLKRVDPLSTLLAVPAITCFLMALQWGGGEIWMERCAHYCFVCPFWGAVFGIRLSPVSPRRQCNCAPKNIEAAQHSWCYVVYRML